MCQVIAVRNVARSAVRPGGVGDRRAAGTDGATLVLIVGVRRILVSILRHLTKGHIECISTV